MEYEFRSNHSFEVDADEMQLNNSSAHKYESHRIELAG